MQARREQRDVDQEPKLVPHLEPADAAFTFAREQPVIKNLFSGLLVPVQRVETQRVISAGSHPPVVGNYRVIDLTHFGVRYGLLRRPTPVVKVRSF